MLATLLAREKFPQYTLCISRSIKKVVQRGGGLNTPPPQAKQTVNQVIYSVKDATENVRKIPKYQKYLSSMAHKKFNKKCRIMGIIKYKKTNYRKSDVKMIF